MKIIDRRKEALGGQNDTRSRSKITHIAWHYTAVMRKNNSFITNHETYWRNHHGWTYGGYHFYIDVDGNIYQNYNYETVTNGVGGHNSYIINICVEAGSGSDYTNSQIDAREWLTKKVMKDLNIPAKNVLGHKEFSKQSTACPGYSTSQMNEFRKQLDGKVTQSNNVSSGKSTKQLVDEVNRGLHGNGEQRKKSLGSRYQEVQDYINGKSTISSTPKQKTTKQLVDEVNRGIHGNGEQRKRSLGSRYQEVQDYINGVSSKSNQKSTKQLADEVNRGLHGNGEQRKKSLGSRYQEVQNYINKMF